MTIIQTMDDEKVRKSSIRECDVDENGWCHTHGCYMSNCPSTQGDDYRKAVLTLAHKEVLNA